MYEKSKHISLKVSIELQNIKYVHYTVGTQLCYIIKYNTTCQLQVSATLLNHHRVVFSLQRTVLHNQCIYGRRDLVYNGQVHELN